MSESNIESNLQRFMNRKILVNFRKKHESLKIYDFCDTEFVRSLGAAVYYHDFFRDA